jgi:FixJ family two-component response regulator
MNPPCVFLVDDQPAILTALGRLLASHGFATASFDTAQGFLDSDSSRQPGCLVTDLSMPGMGGLALQQALIERASLLPVIFLTGQGDLQSGVHAMKSGATDFLTKPVDEARLVEAVQAALARNRLAHADRAELAELRIRLASLTPREREVMDLIVEGLLNKQVAGTLGAAEKTVKVHRARVMAKMQVRSMSALVRMADRLRQGGELA